MKNKSIELLTNISKALANFSLPEDQINPQDIIDCTIQELTINRNIIPATKFQSIIDKYTNLSNIIINSMPHAIQALTELSLITLNLIPDTIHYYTSREWWERILGSNYSNEFEELRTYITKTEAIEVFNYPFAEKYKNDDVDIYIDTTNNHYYIIYNNKKMYFPVSYSPEDIINYCHGIFMEQDPCSPHCYKKESFNVNEGDVIIDAGVAEGNFALDNIDKASHIYMIEADPEWIDALKLTFNDYSDKVTIIQAYLDSNTYDDHICIDDLNVPTVNYIKMDIEGFERDSLIGAINTLEKNSDLRMAICSYHNKGDEEWISSFLAKYDFITTTSSGYMLAEWEPGALVDVDFRRGLVFGKKNN